MKNAIERLPGFYRFFESISPDNQTFKMIEENQEVCIALNKYLFNASKKNFKEYLLEVIDLNIVTLQLATEEHGMTIEEIEKLFTEKIDVTFKTINLMQSKPGMTYDEARNIVRGNIGLYNESITSEIKDSTQEKGTQET